MHMLTWRAVFSGPYLAALLPHFGVPFSVFSLE